MSIGIWLDNFWRKMEIPYYLRVVGKGKAPVQWASEGMQEQYVEVYGTKIFTQEQVRKLFLSVNWISGNYPERLYKALMHSSTVLTVWDDEKLVGLARVLDDTEMLAQVHYVLVHPDYQGKGIAGGMIEYIKEKYKDFLYIEGMPEDKNNVPFYVKHGFSVMENGAAIQICNLDKN